MNALLALVLLVATGLAGVVGAELWPSATEVDRPPTAASRPNVDSTPAPAPTQVATVNNGVLLTRPLFSQTRRPPDVAGPAAMNAGPGEPLPRLTGILIDGPNRRAIFASASGKSVTVVEGGRLGAYTVEAIGPRQATLVGPGGSQSVRPTFDANLAAPVQAAVPSFASPQFPGIQLPGGVSGGRGPGGIVLPPGASSGSFNSQPATPGFDAGNGSSPGAAR